MNPCLAEDYGRFGVDWGAQCYDERWACLTYSSYLFAFGRSLDPADDTITTFLPPFLFNEFRQLLPSHFVNLTRVKHCNYTVIIIARRSSCCVRLQQPTRPRVLEDHLSLSVPFNIRSFSTIAIIKAVTLYIAGALQSWYHLSLPLWSSLASHDAPVGSTGLV